MREIVARRLAAGEAPEAVGDGIERQLVAAQAVGQPPAKPASPARPPRAAVAPAWSGPPLPLPTLAPVPEFPLHVLPAPLARFFRAAAVALNVPVGFVAAVGLALLGAAVGRSRAARHSRTWAECPALWVAVVGAAKSAVLKLLSRPFWAAERRWRQDHEAAVTSYESDLERHKLTFAEWKAGGGEGDPPPRPVKPAGRQVLIDRFTGEALGRMLLASHRGVAVAKDELSGLAAALDMYRPGGRGDDKQNLLSAWAGASFKVNRAGNGDAPPLLVPNPFLAVCGMLTPDALAAVRGDGRKGRPAGDGWPDRFLWCYPDPLPAAGESWAEIPEDAERGYAELIDALLAVDMTAGEDGPVPHAVPLDTSGRAAWEKFTTALAERTNTLDPADPFRGVLAKLKGYCLRLSCLLWCLRHAAGELDRDAPITGAVVDAAAGLVDFFERHARRCRGVGVDDRAGRVARRMVQWLERNPDLTAFTRSQAFQQLKDGRDVAAGADLDTPLDLLVDHGFVRGVPDAGGGRPGRAPQTSAVNPLWRRSVRPASNSGDFGDGFGGDGVRPTP